jgi:hypothetical protein
MPGPGTVPRKRRPRFGAFVIERPLVPNFFERFARIFLGCFDTRAITPARRVVFVGKILIRVGLLRVLFPPISFFLLWFCPFAPSFLCYCFAKKQCR